MSRIAGLLLLGLLLVVAVILVEPRESGGDVGDVDEPQIAPVAESPPRAVGGDLQADGLASISRDAIEDLAGVDTRPGLCRVEVHLEDMATRGPWEGDAFVVAASTETGLRVPALREAGYWVVEPTTPGLWAFYAIGWTEPPTPGPDGIITARRLSDLDSLNDPGCIASEFIEIDDSGIDLSLTLNLFPTSRIKVRVRLDGGVPLYEEGSTLVEERLREALTVRARTRSSGGDWIGIGWWNERQELPLWEGAGEESNKYRDLVSTWTDPDPDLIGVLSDITEPINYLGLFLGEQLIQDIGYQLGDDDVTFQITAQMLSQGLGGFRAELRGKGARLENVTWSTEGRASRDALFYWTGGGEASGNGASASGWIPGEYVVEFHSPGFMDERVSVKILGGETVDLGRIEPQKTVMVEVSIADGDGNGYVTGVRIARRNEDGTLDSLGSSYPDGEGSLRLDHLGPGTYVLTQVIPARSRTTGRDLRFRPTTIVISEFDQPNVVLLLEPTVPVHLDAKQLPVDDQIYFAFDGVDVATRIISPDAPAIINLLPGSYTWRIAFGLEGSLEVKAPETRLVISP